MIFRGKISDYTNSEPLPGTSWQTTRGLTGQTDDTGNFEIFAEPGESVLFTHTGYKNFKIDNVGLYPNFQYYHLQREDNVLPDVVVTAPANSTYIWVFVAALLGYIYTRKRK